MRAGNKTVWTFISIASRSIGRLVVNKLFAVYLGTSGIALLSHLQNLIGIVVQLSNEGVNRGLAYFLSSDRGMQEKKEITGSALYYNIFLFLAIAIFLLLFSDIFFKFFIETLSPGVFYAIFFAAMALFTLNFFLHTFLLTLRNASIYAVANVFSMLVLIGAVFIGVRTFSMDHAILAFAIGQAASLAVTFVILARYRTFRLLRLKFSAKNFKRLSEFMLMAASVLVFSKLIDFGVRQYVMEIYGLKQTGLWQSVVKLSDIYMSLFLSTVGAVYYPQISALIFDPDSLRKYLKDVLFLVVPVTAGGLALLFLGREMILVFLYSPEFIAAEQLLKYQFVGDFFCILSYLLIYILSAQARTVVFILLQIISATLYLGLIALFSGLTGIESIPIAHAIRFAVLFSVLVILNRRLLF